MGTWNYQRDETQAVAKPIPVGKHRIRIAKAEKAVSKTGKDMLALQFDVSGYNSKLFHYIVFLPDRPEITNRNLTQFFDSFKDIPEGDFNTANWIGKVGACEVKHEDYNGSASAKVKFFISKANQANLPAWVEPENSNGGSSSASVISVPEGVDEEVPFG